MEMDWVIELNKSQPILPWIKGCLSIKREQDTCNKVKTSAFTIVGLRSQCRNVPGNGKKDNILNHNKRCRRETLFKIEHFGKVLMIKI